MADNSADSSADRAADRAADSDAEKAEPQDDFHRKFREALDRKKGAKHANNGPHDAEDKGLAAAKDVKVKREFRRKSG